MEGPLLTKSELRVDNVTTIHGVSSSNDEHIVDITINGDASSTANEQTVPQHEAVQSSGPSKSVWILVEFVVTLVQIVAAIFFLTLTKDEQDQDLEVALFAWIIGYTCASIATLPILSWRLWRYHQNVSTETRMNEVMEFLEKMLKYFFVGWIVVFLWTFLTELSTCLDDTTQHFWLWMALLAFSCIRYVLPNLECAVKSFSWPVAFCLEKIWEFIDKIILAIISLFCCICG